MYGPRGWDRNVPVNSYTAHFTDGQVLEVNVRKHLKDPKYYVKVMALALGRIFLNTRFGTIRVNIQSDCGCGKLTLFKLDGNKFTVKSFQAAQLKVS